MTAAPKLFEIQIDRDGAGLRNPNHPDNFLIWYLGKWTNNEWTSNCEDVPNGWHPAHWHDRYNGFETNHKWYYAPNFICVRCKEKLPEFWQLALLLETGRKE